MNKVTCPTCKAPCTTTVEPRGGDGQGWGTTDAERTRYRYTKAAPQGVASEHITTVRNLLERMNLKGGLGYDVHGWISDALDACDALASAPPAPALSEPVASVLPSTFRKQDGEWCREVLLYSPNSPHDYPEKRVKLYDHPTPAAQGLTKPVAYRAWFDADNGARWLFTLWPEEERLDVTWEPLYTALPSDSAVIPTHSAQSGLHDSDVKAAQGLSDAEPEPLDMNAQVEICRTAQIAFNLGKYQSFERALIRETERAILAASRTTPKDGAK